MSEAAMTPEQHVCAFVKAHPEIRDEEGYIHGKLLDALAGLVADTERRAAATMKEACVDAVCEGCRHGFALTGDQHYVSPTQTAPCRSVALRSLPLTEEGR